MARVICYAIFPFYIFSTSVLWAAESLSDSASVKTEIFKDREWSHADTWRESAFLALVAVDWAQTSQALNRNPPFREANPILGQQPSKGKINVFVALGVSAHVGLAWALAPKWRKYFQYTTIGAEAFCVGSNYFTLRQEY
jgi:hypothetical protein